MKSFYLTFIAFFAIIHLSNAQTPNDQYQYIPHYDPPKSPNASSFERYTSIPVSYQTGQVNYSIPLTNFTVDGLNIPLAMNYGNTGLRVSDVASWVGLGWDLTVGGIITREVRSLPDDGSLGLMTTTYASNLNRLVHNQMTGLERWNYYIQISKKLADVEHDIFHYNILGKSGSFYINSSGQCVQFPQTNNQITYTTQSNHQLATFTVIDEGGNKFLFNTKEESNVTSITRPSAGNVDYYFPSLKGSTWYITQIITKYGRQINFKYNEYSYQQQEKTESGTLYTYPSTSQNCHIANQADNAPAQSKLFITTQVDAKQLTQISWDSGYINFTSGSNRTDIQQIDNTAAIPFLSGISLYAVKTPYAQTGGTLLKNVSFNYLQGARLFLKKITFNTSLGGNDHSYQFSYVNENSSNTLNPFPSYNPNQNSYNAQDYWGYFNGQNANPSLLPYDAISNYPYLYGTTSNVLYNINRAPYIGLDNRVPDPTYASFGMLQTITYPTGGVAQLAYEGNIVQKNHVLTTTGEPDLVNTLPQGVDAQNNPLVTLGGIRVKKISFYTNPTDASPSIIKNIVYDQANFSNKTLPYFLTTMEMDRDLTSVNPPPYGGASMGCTNKYFFDISSSDVVNNPAPIVEYAGVTEFDGPDNSAGQTVHNFANSYFLGSSQFWTAPYPRPFLASWHAREILTSKQLPNGSPVEESLENNNINDPVVQPADFTNTYDQDFFISVIRNDNCPDCVGGPIPSLVTLVPTTDANADAMIGQVYKWDISPIVPEHFVNTGSQKTTYNGSGSSIVDLLNFNYATTQKNLLLPNNTSKTDSKGETVKQLISYPQDYFSATPANTPDTAVMGLVNLINNNILAIPVEQVNLVTKNGTDYVTGATLSVFNPTQVSVAKQYELSLAAPIPLSGFKRSNINASGVLVFDSHYELNTQYISYTTLAQPMESIGRISGIHHAYLWDYNSTYQVADVINASQADIAYNSFEANGTGNWTISAAARTSSGFSGNLSYPLSSTNILTKTGLTASKSYIISYWTAGSSSLSITGTQANYPVKGATVNGWTYYEHLVTGVASVTLSSTTSTNIDEVRLYPKNARMTTWTYNPLVGISSSVNEKSQITYYEYDGLLRLMNIKDKDGNIVKHTDYHYQVQ